MDPLIFKDLCVLDSFQNFELNNHISDRMLQICVGEASAPKEVSYLTLDVGCRVSN